MIMAPQNLAKYYDLNDDADNHCPICGLRFRGTFASHRCSEQSLRGIDAAHHRDPDTEEPRHESFGARLAAGFQMLEEGTPP